MMQSKYFKIVELVHPSILALVGETGAWRLIGKQPIVAIDALREALGKPIWINGNGLVDCGVRTQDSATGAKLSRHKLTVDGVVAFDLHTPYLTELRAIVAARGKELHIVRTEDPASTPDWCHVEIADEAQPFGPTVFKP